MERFGQADSRSPLRRSYESEDPLFLGQDLIDRCGSIDQLESLTAEPLPAHPVDWGAVPAEDRPLLETLLSLIEPMCLAELDDEYISIVRRLVERCAAHPSRPLRARSRPERLAAALVWVATLGNAEPRVLRTGGIGDIWWWFGVTSCTTIGRTLATTVGFRPTPRYGEEVGWDRDEGVYLRDPALLHSRYRRSLIAQTASLNDYIVEHEERKRLARPMVQSEGQVRLRMVESEFAVAAKTNLRNGRHVVMLGLGGTVTDPDHLFALSIPEARRLLQSVQHAVDSTPIPTLTP